MLQLFKLPTSLLFCLIFITHLALSINYIEFNLVYGGVTTTTNQYFQIQIFDSNVETPQKFILSSQTEDLTTFSYIYATSTAPSAETIQYNYIFNNETIGVIAEENFKRSLESCRIKTINNNKWITKYEYFNQSQLYLGLDKVPLFANNANGIPPEYYDDNQVMTLSFILTDEALAELWSTSNNGDDYVKTNMSYVSLTTHKYLTDIKIRRAGGASFSVTPYSYQVKMNKEMNLGGIDRVFKLKAYPYDYQSKKGGILSEKMAADLVYALGAPINYVSYVRVFFNHIDQGLYGMLEKVDDQFIERRWPYIDSGAQVGTIYKVQGSFNMLTQTSWTSGTQSFLQTQSDGGSVCCPCAEADCDFKRPDCSDDPSCDALSCCSCTWESNGTLETEDVNCQTQTPFGDLINLGNSVLYENESNIKSFLNSESYLKSIAAELLVMNADGYIYNRKNYYWYQDGISGQFYLILYDQDVCFCKSEYVYNGWEVDNWSYIGNLTDALFLPTLLLNQELKNMYIALLTDVVANYFRSDNSGTLFQRLSTFSKFIAEFNPSRKEIVDEAESFVFFIDLLSSKLQEQLNISSLPPVGSSQSPTCG